MTIKIHFEGEVYTVDILNFNAVEIGYFRKKFGKSLLASLSELDLDTAAQLLFMHMRKTNAKIKYERIAANFTYRDLMRTKQDTEMADEDEDIFIDVDGVTQSKDSSNSNGSGDTTNLDADKLDFTTEAN